MVLRVSISCSYRTLKTCHTSEIIIIKKNYRPLLKSSFFSPKSVTVTSMLINTWSCDVFPFFPSFFNFFFFFCYGLCAVRGQAGGDVMRKLSNDNDDAVAEERQRGPGV